MTASLHAAAVLLVALLAVLLALFEAALTALTRMRHRHRRPLPGTHAATSLAADPLRARQAATLVRLLLLAAMLVVAALSWAQGAAWPALTTAGALAALHLLEQQGRLRLFGARTPQLAVAAAAVLRPFVALLPAVAPEDRGPADSGEVAGTLEDLADRFATAPADWQHMVQALLELGQSSVEDVMVPRSEVVGVDLQAAWDEIVDLLVRTPHTRLPAYDGDLQYLVGVLHMKRVANELAGGRLSRERLRELAGRRDVLFVPEGTSLQTQLAAFRRLRRRIAFVVDEYGDVLGLLTLEDILEEIVGEFTTQPGSAHRDIQQQPDGSLLVAGGVPVRSLNRSLGWRLPTGGPRTLSGLIIESLEAIPAPGTSLTIGEHRVEILQVADNMVRTARIRPAAGR